MLPQNTFLIKQNEKIETESSSFINILCPQLLEFINESFFDRTIIFNSSPGGGKSTLLRTFSPEVLLELYENSAKETYKDTYALLHGLGALDHMGVKLLSVHISCAKENYSLIDDLYENGKAIQVFFELLSLRILRRTLMAVLKCNQAEEGDLKGVTFKNIPDEWNAIYQQYPNGGLLYQWAVEREARLCESIEEMDAEIVSSMMFNNLSVLNLIGNGNILLEGKPIRQKILVMIDDMHALNGNQRSVFRDAIFKIRPNLAVWMTQRLIALSAEEIFGVNGRVHREYEIINLDDHIQQNKKSFYKALKDVADRRVAVTYKDEIFEDKLEKSLSQKSEKKLGSILFKIKQKIDLLCKNNDNFTNLYEYLEQREYASEWERVVSWQILQILIEREIRSAQLILPMISRYSIEEYEEEYNKLNKMAEFLICYHFNLPVYSGLNVLQVLSSCNVEQFLDFAGEIFELRIALDYVSKRRRKALISQEEQEKVIVKCAEEKWRDILRTFSLGSDIQIFIENIAKLGTKDLQKNTVSYPGGTFTGIGIKKTDMDGELDGEKNQLLLKMLKICVSYNLLLCQEIRHGKIGTIYKVFYLNRWICVRFKLPLGYGGWKPLSLDSVNKLLEKDGD